MRKNKDYNINSKEKSRWMGMLLYEKRLEKNVDRIVKKKCISIAMRLHTTLRRLCVNPTDKKALLKVSTP